MRNHTNVHANVCLLIDEVDPTASSSSCHSPLSKDGCSPFPDYGYQARAAGHGRDRIFTVAPGRCHVLPAGRHLHMWVHPDLLLDMGATALQGLAEQGDRRHGWPYWSRPICCTYLL
jgi:hypothetical protein